MYYRIKKLYNSEVGGADKMIALRTKRKNNTCYSIYTVSQMSIIYLLNWNERGGYTIVILHIQWLCRSILLLGLTRAIAVVAYREKMSKKKLKVNDECSTRSLVAKFAISLKENFDQCISYCRDTVSKVVQI